MARKPIAVRVVDGGEGRFLLKTYADGAEERVPIVKEPRKEKRLSKKVAWYWDLKTGTRKFY